MNLSRQRLEYAASICPSPRQLAWQQLEFYGFLHFGMNTFTDREWGDGTESPSLFDPADLDADEWAAAAKSAGMTGLILTCKHHDGFCLWPSAYTEHSVKNSPWRGGRGDVVREVAEACRRAGLKFGVYLSPWDRHEPTYGSGAAYNDYYLHQLTELATGYGPIFCFWFDGACGEGPNGRSQRYDWQAYYAVIRRCQPDAVISVCGPDVRWCGNEAGHARTSEWSVVPAPLRDNDRIAANSQQVDDGAFSRRIGKQDEDLGSRAVIGETGELVWYPAEVDTSIRPGWFYHPAEDGQLRTTQELFRIYQDAVGGNASLLLNLPPTPQGRIAAPDRAVLRALGEKIRALYALPVTPRRITATSFDAAHPAADALTESGWWQAAPGSGEAGLTLDMGGQTLRTVVLQEELRCGQRIEAGRVWADGSLLAEFTTVGHKRILSFAPRTVQKLTVQITAARAAPTLRTAVYK